MSKYYLKVTHIPTDKVIAITEASTEEDLFNLQDICAKFGEDKLQYLELVTAEGSVTIPVNILKDCTILLKEVACD
ncbi:hypothetical protein NVP1193O_211 [Vibrio phage 1.193.O._10N.286.52.C6]|nr:hypothetical protein NVP1193O_211 [Vibrio phage 1.193.O._10N.286.52.C6]